MMMMTLLMMMMMMIHQTEILPTKNILHTHYNSKNNNNGSEYQQIYSTLNSSYNGKKQGGHYTCKYFIGQSIPNSS